MTSILYSILLIVLPWAIGKFRAFQANRALNQQHLAASGYAVPRFTRGDLVVYSTLALAFLYQLVFIVDGPPNLFRTLGLSHDAPGYELRRVFRNYANERAAAGDLDFFPTSEGIAGVPDLATKRSNSFDSATYVQSAYGAMDWAIDRVAGSSRQRHLYGMYGQNAFLSCPICTNSDDTSDYLLYVSSGIAGSYLGVLILFGIITAIDTPKAPGSARSSWRTIIVALLAAMCLIDLYTFLDGAVSIRQEFARENVEDAYFWFNTIDRLRRSFFVVLIAAYGLLDFFIITNSAGASISASSEGGLSSVAVKQMVNKLQSQTEAGYQNAILMSIMRSAIMRDGYLREKTIETVKQAVKMEAAVDNQEQVRAIKEQVAAKYEAAGLGEVGSKLAEQIKQIVLESNNDGEDVEVKDTRKQENGSVEDAANDTAISASTSDGGTSGSKMSKRSKKSSSKDQAKNKKTD